MCEPLATSSAPSDLFSRPDFFARFTQFGLGGFPELQNLLKNYAWPSVWFPTDMDFAREKPDFDSLNVAEKYPVTYCMGFFTWGDEIVLNHLSDCISKYFSIIPEVRLFLQYQDFIEGIHTVTYKENMQAIFTPEKIDLIQKHMVKSKAMNSKANFRNNVMAECKDENELITTSVLVQIIMEGIFFMAGFTIPFWMKKREKMPGFCDANVLISADESLHKKFYIELWRLLKSLGGKIIGRPELTLPSIDQIYALFDRAVQVEFEFIDEAMIRGPLLDLNANQIKDYVKWICNDIFLAMGYPAYYPIYKNPLPWMDGIGQPSRTNPHERDSVYYNRSEHKRFSLTQQVRERMDMQ